MATSQSHPFQGSAWRPAAEPSLTLASSQDCSSKATCPGKATTESSCIPYPMLPPSASLLQASFSCPKEHGATFGVLSPGPASVLAGSSAAHDHPQEERTSTSCAASLPRDEWGHGGACCCCASTIIHSSSLQRSL